MKRRKIVEMNSPRGKRFRSSADKEKIKRIASGRAMFVKTLGESKAERDDRTT